MNQLSRFSINYNKIDTLNIKQLEQSYIYTEEDLSNNYNPFRIENFQNYNPLYNRVVTFTEDNYNSIQLDHKFLFINTESVMDIHNNTLHLKPIFIKYSPLLDPIRYMIGKYVKDGDTIYKLPQFKSEPNQNPKLNDSNNAAYIDSFFYFLTSKALHAYDFIHGIDFYGSFLGIQDKYKMNVADDIEYLITSPYFNENVDKLFSVCNQDTSSYFADSSRTNRKKLKISNTNNHNISAISLPDCLSLDDTSSACESNLIYENNNHIERPAHNQSSSTTSTSSSDNSRSNSTSDEDNNSDEDDSDWETDSNEDDETNSETESEIVDEPQYAYINKFPVQLICLEKCKGTLDDLFSKHQINEDIAAAALFQIIMILISYQKMFHFTHNDLHTNNVMYIETDEPYLYYKYENIPYKVPTYGKIFKLIDFGRSIYKFNGEIMCSDSFAPGGDAATQYNCEPYIDETKPIIEPNYSFDLCRLGCSIYDFIIPDDCNYSKYDEFQKTVYRWCLDDNGKNILYKKNGEERYPNFKLYKMAARTVHKHTPEAQLKYPFFKQFVTLYETPDVKYIDIDKLPCLADKI